MDTTKNESGLPIPSDLISRKAITASDVVKPTRKCNGVTKFPKSLKKIGSFYSMKSSLAQIHITMCMYVFSLILHSASDEMNFIIIANLVKVL